ncbi:MAG TPA: hypothetical protein PLW65_04575, partial [Pseudomonadota bacterium]|nr:hypothetical protein [Pseudomonadota bacterium]
MPTRPLSDSAVSRPSSSSAVGPGPLPRRRRARFRWLAGAGLLALLGGAPGPHAGPAAVSRWTSPPLARAAAPAESADAQLTRLLDTFFDEYQGYYPTEATIVGLHQHDGELEDL